MISRHIGSAFTFSYLNNIGNTQAGYSMIMAIIVVQAAKVGPEWYPLKALIQLLLAMYLNFISFDR